MRKLIFVLLFIVLSVNAQDIPTPDNFVKGTHQVLDNIVVKMEDIDDTSFVFVKNKNGFRKVSSAEWVGGIHGESQKSISKYLREGDNYIVFSLFNKKYKEFLFFKGGKWSFDMSLYKNGQKIWSKFMYVKNNTPGLKYWKIFKITVNSQGYVENIDEFVDKKMIKILKDEMNHVNEVYINQTNESSPL